MAQEYPEDVKDWTLDHLMAFIKDEDKDIRDVGDVAIDLVRRGTPAAEIARRVGEDDDYSHWLISGIAREYDSATAPYAEELIDAFLVRLDVNHTFEWGNPADEVPADVRTILGEAALELRPRLVQFLLMRGADPMAARAEAVNAAIWSTMPGGHEGARPIARVIVVLLLQYGLSPRLLTREQMKYLFDGVRSLSLLRIPAAIREQLPGLNAAPLHLAEAALTAAVGRNLARYVSMAL